MHCPHPDDRSSCRQKLLIFILLALLSPISSSRLIAQDDVRQSLAAIRGIGTEGKAFEQAIPAADQLRGLAAGQIGQVLDALDTANPVAANWLRGIAFDVARSSPPPMDLLIQYAMDQTHNADGRGLAMELIGKQDSTVAEDLIAKCLSDPSLPLREMAVEQAIEQATALSQTDDKSAAISRFQDALDSARHPRQLSRIIEGLGKLDEVVTTSDAFSMITQWKAVAPFNNVGGVGFDTAYPPETAFVKSATVDLDRTYDGKHGSIGWKDVESSGDDGKIDLAAAFDQEKGAVCYLVVEFESSRQRLAQLRLSSITANKAWVNGIEIMANEVYHSGIILDQYIAACELAEGTNRILLKICQDEMTEDWAQTWEFQCRVTDPSGKGLRSGE